jgi:hypothetical protein
LRLSPQVQLLLRAADGSIGFGVNASQPGPDGDLMLQNAQPGRYFVYAQSFRGYVASITSDGVDLMQQPLVVNAGGTAPPIDITLRDDSATITGTVTSSSGPLPRQSFILLLPTDATAQFTQSFAGPDGKFTVPNLAPGSYRAFAFRSNRMRQQIPYRDAEAMRQYDGKGVTITASPDQQVQLDVPLLDEAEVENN